VGQGKERGRMGKFGVGRRESGCGGGSGEEGEKLALHVSTDAFVERRVEGLDRSDKPHKGPHKRTHALRALAIAHILHSHSHSDSHAHNTC
jgi:hypothetical protein